MHIYAVYEIANLVETQQDIDGRNLSNLLALKLWEAENTFDRKLPQTY